MAIGGAGIAAGIGALWLFLRGRSSGGAPPQCPGGWVFDTATGKCIPVGGAPNVTGANNTTRDVQIAAGVAGAVLQVGGAVLSTVAGAGVAPVVAAGGAGASTGKAVAGGGVSAGAAVATVGAMELGVGLALIAVIIALVVGANVFWAVQGFQESLLAFFRQERATVRARTWFSWFVGAALTAGKPPSLGYVPAYGPYTLKLPTEIIRKAVLTALYLEYVGKKAHYDALEGFWSRSTGQVPAPGTPVPMGGSAAGADQPWQPVYPPPAYTTEQIKYVLSGPGIFQCGAADCNPNAIVAPAGFGEAQSAALSLLGDNWRAATALQEFGGKASAIAFATAQLFKEFMPSGFEFATAVRDTVVPGWRVEEATYWTTKKQPLTAYWLVDPVTGNRVAPYQIRETMTMVVSIKGMEVSQGVFARFAGRRFSGFAGPGSGVIPGECCADKDGNIVPCSDKRTVAIVACPTIESQAAIDQQRLALKLARHGYQPTPAASGAGGGSVLPWAAGAWLLAKVFLR